jgi:hypothetical protein
MSGPKTILDPTYKPAAHIIQVELIVNQAVNGAKNYGTIV